MVVVVVGGVCDLEESKVSVQTHVSSFLFPTSQLQLLLFLSFPSATPSATKLTDPCASHYHSSSNNHGTLSVLLLKEANEKKVAVVLMVCLAVALTLVAAVVVAAEAAVALTLAVVAGSFCGLEWTFGTCGWLEFPGNNSSNLKVLPPLSLSLPLPPRQPPPPPWATPQRTRVAVPRLFLLPFFLSPLFLPWWRWRSISVGWPLT